MSVSVDDLLRVRPLTSMFTSFGDSSRDNLFTGFFQAGERVQPPGDEVRWDEVQTPRGLAPVTGPESPAKRVDRTTLIPRVSSIMFVKEYTDISAHRLYKQRAPGTDVANARRVLDIELRGLKARIGKTIEKACGDSLQGKLQVDSTKFPGSDISFTVDYTGKFTALAPSAAWSAATTKISANDIPKFEDAYLKACGLLPAIALHNISVEISLRKNDDVRTWCQNQRYAGNMVESPVITTQVLSDLQLGGMQWRKHNGYFADKTGALTKFMADNTLIVLPEMGEMPNMLGFAEATTFTPKDVYGTEGQIGFVETQAGFFAWAETIKNPVGIRLYAGWVGLPYVKFAKALGIATGL